MYRHRILTSILAAVLVMSIGFYWTRTGQLLYRQEQRFYMTELINTQVRLIEQSVNRAVTATELLAEVVEQTGGNLPDFGRLASKLQQGFDALSSIQIAPGGVVRQVYPLKGNEAAVGHDLLADPVRRPSAKRAIAEHRTLVAGPLDLLQGGKGIIIRHPIYVREANQETFWGFATVVLRISDLLARTELDPEGRKGYSHRLSFIHPGLGKPVVFSTSATPLTRDRYFARVTVPDSLWELEMSRSTPTPKWRSTTGYVASVLAALLMGWLANVLLRTPERLQRIVEEKTAELERLAYFDPLTDLANRRFLLETLEQLVEGFPRYGEPAALLYLDLDGFKEVNDTLGHDAGDALLREVALRLKANVRSSDLVARLGGDEFAILLRHTDSVQNVAKVAQKMIDQIERPVPLAGRSVNVSASVGVTRMPADGDSVKQLLTHADLAMYAAKHAGKRCYRFYESGMAARAQG
ncbi:MAG: sensor domain-containing diguanylate cyclase [Gammaproteobacteria bacterium]|nr:MAG: sensor domain-containing diguanylate cyclase [Gammaproteobacteria bacterium]